MTTDHGPACVRLVAVGALRTPTPRCRGPHYRGAMYLLDTNLLAPRGDNTWLPDEGLFTSSVSAQEVLGMQRPGREAGYRYALPVLNGRATGALNGGPNEYFTRIAIEHAVRSPVSKLTDRRVVPRSHLRTESLELGHEAVTIAHEQGNDRLLRAFASRGLSGTTLKRVLAKWDYLRSDVEAIIPLNEAIVDQALVLANLFVANRFSTKGTARNTMNDMLVAATSQIEGIALLTADAQLNEFYSRFGWSVREVDSLYLASPTQHDHSSHPGSGRRAESRRFINRPRSFRTRSSETPPPLPR